ncbi:uncharacterized protein LOC9638130 [Selaginella moellendorffii]|nr:uncharacterized protein LOC9638130 [Selaginella moellendorffii]|eukprot:XP_002989756.2 uncharacterized protein LOC9638130 [Selaginella moellendorffii]
MGYLLRALSKAGGATRSQCRSFLVSSHHNESKIMVLLLPASARGISSSAATALASSKSGTFSEGKFSAEAASEEEEEDLDPDSTRLHRTEVVPYNLLCNTLIANPYRSPKAVVAEWQEQTKTKFTREMLFKLFRKLWGRQRHDQVYKIMRWVLVDKPLPVSSKIYELSMKAAQKANKLQVVKRIFDDMPPEAKTPAVYTRIMSAYCNKNRANKAEFILDSFTPTTAQAHNQLMLMYIRMEEDEKAVDAYNRMRKAGIKPSDLTFWTLAKYSRRLGIEIDKKEAETILDDTLSSLDTKKDGLNAATNAMLAYAYMGDFSGVKKAWALIESHDHIPTYAFAAGVEAFGQVGKMETVYHFTERVESWKKPDLMTFYPSLVRAYVTNGRMDRAVGLVNHLKNKEGERKIPFGCYDELIAGHIALKERDLAMEKTKEALEVCCPRTRPSYLTLKKMLPVYKKAKDVEAAEALFARYKGWRDARVFNQLLEVYIAAERPAPLQFEFRMMKSKVADNEETTALLAKSREFAKAKA